MRSLLEALGQRGTAILAAGIVVGLILPDLAAFMRPALAPAVFGLLALAMTRVRMTEIRKHAAQRARLGLSLLWIGVLMPVLVGIVVVAVGVEQLGIGLALGIILLSSAPPIFSSPAISYLLGLDGALALAIMLITTTLTPIIAPLAVELFIGPDLPLSPLVLFRNLAILVGGSYALAFVARRMLGEQRINSAQGLFDGMNVILMVIFAIALMDGISAQFLANPLRFLMFVAIVSGLVAVMMAISTVVFWRTGAQFATSVGYLTGFRNMALAVGALGSAVPPDTWTIFAVNQFPIYLGPALLTPVCRRLLG